MTKTALLSLFTCLFVTLAQAQNNDIYTIYIGTFLNAQINDFSNISDLGYLYDENYDESLLKIYMGSYTSQAKAQAVLNQVKKRGYADAFAVARKDGSDMYVIQLAAERAGNSIKWARYQNEPQLKVFLQDEYVRIVEGPYSSKAQADAALAMVRKRGHSDAFIRKAPAQALSTVSEFETGGTVLPSAAKARIEKKKEEKVKEAEALLSSEPGENDDEEFVLFSYENVMKKDNVFEPAAIDSKADQFTDKGVPDIRSDLKRSSVSELQKLLKQQGTYASSVDGLYGKGTKGGFDDFKRANRDMHKYQLLAKYPANNSNERTTSPLEGYIQLLPESPNEAMRGLEVSSEPIAKAYRAYHYFYNNQSRNYVNELMNAAIKDAFKNRRTDGLPFDPNATYAYENMDQLLLHLSYIQKVSDPEPAAPCWLFERHPKEANKAYMSGRSISPMYEVQECDQFMSWPDLQLLQVISEDLCADLNKASTQSNIRKNAIERTRIFLSPGTLAKGDEKLIEEWNDDFWKSMEVRGEKDPMLKRIMVPFKASYLQSLVLLEDYFIDQGISKQQARPIALYTLHTIVEPYF